MRQRRWRHTAFQVVCKRPFRKEVPPSLSRFAQTTSGLQGVPMPPMEQALQVASNGALVVQFRQTQEILHARHTFDNRNVAFPQQACYSEKHCLSGQEYCGLVRKLMRLQYSYLGCQSDLFVELLAKQSTTNQQEFIIIRRIRSRKGIMVILCLNWIFSCLYLVVEVVSPIFVPTNMPTLTLSYLQRRQRVLSSMPAPTPTVEMLEGFLST
jgi:hypothetical protein